MQLFCRMRLPRLWLASRLKRFRDRRKLRRIHNPHDLTDALRRGSTVTSTMMTPSRAMSTEDCPLTCIHERVTFAQKCEAKPAMNFATRSRPRTRIRAAPVTPPPSVVETTSSVKRPFSAVRSLPVEPLRGRPQESGGARRNLLVLAVQRQYVCERGSPTDAYSPR